MAQDTMPMATRTKTEAVAVPRTRRVQEHRVLTSFQPGKCVPIMAFPLLREDSLTRLSLRIAFEQMETVELLANAVSARALAYFVPFSSFDRFFGMDDFNRSYMKAAAPVGQTTPTFITAAPFLKASMPVLTTMGFHARENQSVNMAYVEAYNEIFNLRCRNRSKDLYTSSKRTALEATLAPAFWNHQLFANTVPDFDQASIEGEVPLSFGTSRAPVSGIGVSTVAQGAASATNSVRYSGSTVTSTAQSGWVDADNPASAAGKASFFLKNDPANALFPQVWAELANAGATISLANLDLARRTQAFALIRKQYNMLEDDHIIDMMMSGLTVPEGDLKHPMLLADRSTVFGMAKRYATTADDLTASVTNGGAFIDMNIRVPRQPVGGIVMVLVEVAPEQLFERMLDPMLASLDQALWPEFVRDTLDPEKVDIVQCQEVDVQHTTPTATFGYVYMNEKWAKSRPKVGGKFYRPSPDGAFDEDRQRLWAVETANPTLSRDFYLCGTVHRKPFVDTTSDAYEVTAFGQSTIEGNTVFGRPLIEATDDYAQILAQAPGVPQIPKPAAELEAEGAPMSKPTAEAVPAAE